MVIWVFAGGGEAEVKGLIPFLEKHFSGDFERKSPIRQKPHARPIRGESPQKKDVPVGYGKTGQSLAYQIEVQLSRAFLTHDRCDLILVLDDLDCHDIQQRRQMFIDVIERLPEALKIPKCIAFASPELEAWIIADWDNSFAKAIDFRKKHQAMKWWLSQEKAVSFENPESFSEYDPYKKACKEKLSDAIIEASITKSIEIGKEGDKRYSKGTHTPQLLQQIDPNTVRSKCPLFNELYICLSTFCQ